MIGSVECFLTDKFLFAQSCCSLLKKHKVDLSLRAEGNNVKEDPEAQSFKCIGQSGSAEYVRWFLIACQSKVALLKNVAQFIDSLSCILIATIGDSNCLLMIGFASVMQVKYTAFQHIISRLPASAPSPSRNGFHKIFGKKRHIAYGLQ